MSLKSKDSGTKEGVCIQPSIQPISGDLLWCTLTPRHGYTQEADWRISVS